MLTVYPFGSGSYYTASYAISSSFATSASKIDYVVTASLAGNVLNPTVGPMAAVNICLLTYEDYLAMLPSTDIYEVCNF